MNAVDPAEGLAPESNGRGVRIALAVILVIATVLRLLRIDDQLWLDEISALTGSIQRDFFDIVTRWPGAASHILYELLARAGLATIGLPIGIRMPAVIFGVAGVAIAYAFSRRAFGVRPALLISALHAVSFHHVFFSQNARGYTLLMALYLTTLLLLAKAQYEGARRRVLVSYALAGALAAYSMPMGLFVLPGQGLVLLALWAWSRRTGHPARGPAAMLGAAVAGGAIATLLYAPFVRGIIGFTRTNVETPEEGPRLGLGLVREVLDGLRGAFHGPVGLALVVVLGIAGIVIWWRRHPTSLAFACAPLVLEALAVVVVGIGIHPRYFAVALPVLLIVAGLGLDVAVSAALMRLSVSPSHRTMLTRLVLSAAVLLSGWPLLRYYRYPKQDFRGAIAAVNSMRPACDRKVGIGVAGHVLEGYYLAGFSTAETFADLRRMESETPGRICVVTTLEPLLTLADAEIVPHLRRDYRQVALLPGTLGDGAMRIYERKRP